MGKKIRHKDKKRKPKKKGFNEARKENTMNDLANELDRISEQKKTNPGGLIKNKQKRKEIVLLRAAQTKRIKGKLRRKKQAAREEFGEEAAPIKPTKTIDNQREFEPTYLEKEDDELEQEKKHDEFSDYFNKSYEPQILLTTGISHTAGIFKFIKEMKECIPNSYFYYRKKFSLKEIIEQAKEKGFSDVIVIHEKNKKPGRMIITHLPNGPTAEFKISNVVYHDEIEGAAKVQTECHPEILFKNFKTKLGFRMTRIINSLFPKQVDIVGRRVVTWHNQRDFIFFRHHRYVFNEEFDKVTLQESGPRFTLRLLAIQNKTYDGETGDYEWYYKDNMGVVRRKFHL